MVRLIDCFHSRNTAYTLRKKLARKGLAASVKYNVNRTFPWSVYIHDIHESSFELAKDIAAEMTDSFDLSL
jgi:hypothetical protein